jgi:magnesium chelatase accessory protein
MTNPVPPTGAEQQVDTLDVAGMRWRVASCGSGDRVLLLHGTGATGHTWDPLFAFLSSRVRLVAVDLPGHGGTSHPGFAQVTCDRVSRAVAELMNALDMAPVAVIAHSAGAAVMLQLAATGALRPETRLIGINPALEAPGALARAILRGPVGDLLRAPASRALVRTAARASPLIELLLASTGSRLSAQQERDYVTAFRSGDHADAAYAMMANWDLLPLRRALPTIAHDTLFVVGAGDRWISPAVARDAATRMPHARVEVLQGGHLLHEERPVEVARLIRAALGDAEP